jgi:hypothetical protein
VSLYNGTIPPLHRKLAALHTPGPEGTAGENERAYDWTGFAGHGLILSAADTKS